MVQSVLFCFVWQEKSKVVAKIMKNRIAFFIFFDIADIDTAVFVVTFLCYTILKSKCAAAIIIINQK